MTRTLSLLLPLALITLSACAGSKGFDRGEMQEVMRQTVNLTQQQASAGVTEPAPTISAPFRLGLFFTHKDFPTRRAIVRAEWVSRDKDGLLRALAPLQDQHLLSHTIVIADSTVQLSNLTEIRKAAARYDVDVIMIVTGVGAVDRYNNWYASLYPTIIGAYLAPGTVSDALFLIEGSLWDVRSGVGYGTQKAEGTATKVGPATSLEDQEVLDEAKAAALEALGRKLPASLAPAGRRAPPSPDRSR